MGGITSQAKPGVVAPGACRLYETSAGLVRAMFGGSLSLAKVAPDGWMPVFGAGQEVARSAPGLTSALEKLGFPSGEAARLAERILSDWEAIAVPEPRPRGQRMTDVLRLAVLTLRVLARMPRLVWWVMRDRERDIGSREERPWLVRPGSSQFGAIRVVKTSIGWTEFEFWGGPQARLSVYRQDGWLPLGGQRFNIDRPDLIRVLRAQGLARDEAEQVANLVLAERQARVAADA